MAGKALEPGLGDPRTAQGEDVGANEGKANEDTGDFEGETFREELVDKFH